MIISFWITQAALSVGCTDFLTKEHHHLLVYVANIIQKNFSPGTSVDVYLPSIGHNSTWRHRKLKKCQHISSDLDLASKLLKTHSEEHVWGISTSHDDTTILTDYNVQKSHSYVIFITSGQVLDAGIYSELYTLYVQPMWNSKANFLVVITDHLMYSSEEIAKNVLEELWVMLKVLNAVAVVPVLDTSLSLEGTDHIPAIDTYTWEPQQSEKMCMELAEIVRVHRWYWGLGENLHSRSNLYTNKLPSDFLGCPLKVATPLKNYIWVTNDKNESILKYNENEIKFLELVFKKLNFTMVLGPPEPIISDYTRSIFNKLQELVLSDYNLAIGELPLITEIAEHADYTFSHLSYYAKWFVPCGRHESRETTISRIFSASVWIIMAFILFVASILMASMGAHFKRNNFPEFSIFTNVTACLFALWAVTLGVSSPELPRTTKVRLFFILFVWYSLAINTVFQTYFTSFIVQPGIKHSIENLEELLKSGIEFGFDPFFDVLINGTSDWKYEEAMKRRRECTDRNYCLGRVAITGDFAYFDVWIAKWLYSLSHESKFLCLLDDGQINIVLTMYMKKGEVLIDKFNPTVLAIIEAGLYKRIQSGFVADSHISGAQSTSKWFTPTVNATFVAPSEEMLIQEEYTPLTLTHLYIAFYFIITGYILSVFAILGEILAYRIHLSMPAHLVRR